MIEPILQRRAKAVMLVLFFLPAAGPADLAATEDAIDFRHERVISLNPVTTAADQVVKVTLTTELMGRPYRNMNADGSDLRFTSADGRRRLNYWIDRWDPAGTSYIWVKIDEAGSSKVMMRYGNPAAISQSDGEGVFDFFDDFDNGIWTKPVDRPVYTPSQDREHPDAHRQLFSILCEPSVIVENGLFRMWYATREGPWGSEEKSMTNGVAYATSTDGIHWERYPVHPLIPEVSSDRVTVSYALKHKGAYHLYACDSEIPPRNIRLWISTDGIDWVAKGKVLIPGKGQEKMYGNPAVFVDDDGIWKMFISQTLNTSEDGVHWTKVNGGAEISRPPDSGGFWGDPFVYKVGDTYFCWHSQGRDDGPLMIAVHQSKDLIHWTDGGIKNPQIGHTQLWERGLGTADVQCARQIADTHIAEHAGKLWLYYCGTQSQFGLAVFEGTWQDLADRMLHNPPLAKWDANSFVGSVEDNQLKISDDASRTQPLLIDSETFSDSEGYIFEFKARKYAGASYQIMPVVRYLDDTTFAQFWLYDKTTTWYHETRNPASPREGRWGWQLGTINVGANRVCDDKWHDWKIVVKGADNTLYIDGRLIGSCKSIPQLVNQDDLKVGFSTFDTFAAFDNVRVRKYSDGEITCTVSPEKRVVALR